MSTHCVSLFLRKSVILPHIMQKAAKADDIF